jgi:hypothetical protein
MTVRLEPALAPLAALAAMLFAAPALAAPVAPAVDLPAQVARTVSYTSWNVEGDVVRLRFSLPHDARRALQAKGARPLDVTDISNAVLGGVGVSSRGGDCDAIDQGEGVGQVYPLAMNPTLDRFEIVFQCPVAQGIVLHDHVLFDKAREHIDFAQVAIGTGRPRLETFTREHQDVRAQPSPFLADPSTHAVVLRSAQSLFLDPLRLCALIAMVLTIGRWRYTLKVGAAVLIGYCAALAAAAAGFEAPDIRLDRGLEDLITLAIALGAVLSRGQGLMAANGWRRASIGLGILIGAGVLALAVPKGAPAILAVAGAAIVTIVQALATRGGDWRPRVQLLLVGFLAALDGLSQTTLLSPLNARFGMAAPVLAEMTFGAACAICLTLAAAQAARWITRGRLAAFRTGSGELIAAGVAGAGLFWFASQLYSL